MKTKLLTAVCLVMTLSPCWAQTPTAQITGRITDSSGAVVPSAQVELTNVDTGVRWTTTSNESGYYVVPLLPPGNYRITVHVQGFKPMTQDGVTLVVDQVARLDFTLQIGAVTESIHVTAVAPLLESQSASLGQVVQPRAMSDLPLNGRNFLQLAKLAAGVVEPSRGDRALAGGAFVANGVRAQLNNFLLDGADNNAKILDIQNSSNVVIQPSVDALQEFKVETHNFSAEFAYSAGAVINATIKSGTNHFHGTAFEFLRNDHLDARNFFLRPGDPKPPHQRNQFGGVLGGPVVPNKAFFFGSFERTTENQAPPIVRTLPSRAMKSGDFTGQATIFDPTTLQRDPSRPGMFLRTPFAGNLIPSGSIDRVAAKVIALLPDPNLPGNSNNFVVSRSQRDRRNQYDFRGDQSFSDSNKLFVRYSYFNRNFTNPGPFDPPLIGTENFQQAEKSQSGHGLALGETHLFSPSVVNEFRFGYNRIRDFLDPFVKDSIASQFGFVGIPPQPGVTGLPHFVISGFSDLGEATFLPNQKISETAEFSDSVSWIRGKQLGFSSANTGNARPDRLRDGNLPDGLRSVDHYFDTSAFAVPTPFNFGNAGRNILSGPGAANLDFSVFKRVPVRKLGEAGEVQLRGEFFNALNTPQFGTPNARVDLQNAPQGGSVRLLATPMREVQLGLKIIF